MKKRACIIALIIVLFVAACFVGYSLYEDSKNKNNTTEENIKIVTDVEFVKEVKYNYEISSKSEVTKDNGNNKEFPFVVLTNNEKYEYFNDYLTLKDGVPTVVKEDKTYASNKTDIKKIYVIFSGESISWFAYLTNDGDVYIGKYMTNVGEKDYTLTNDKGLNNVQKVDSKNQYKSLSRINLGDLTDDTLDVHIVGTTTNNKTDLIKLNYSE